MKGSQEFVRVITVELNERVPVLFNDLLCNGVTILHAVGVLVVRVQVAKTFLVANGQETEKIAQDWILDVAKTVVAGLWAAGNLVWGKGVDEGGR